MWYGSVQNRIAEQSAQVEPQVGMGATITAYTDRYAATIVKVTAVQVHVRRDIATRIDKNGFSESQEYSYQPNPEALIDIFRKTKRGWRNSAGNGLLIGERRAYHDFSF